jgi:hypothetical protein
MNLSHALVASILPCSSESTLARALPRWFAAPTRRPADSALPCARALALGVPHPSPELALASKHPIPPPRGRDCSPKCNALNLGVEFFLLFTHQIQVLLPFLFPFRPFFPISKQYSDWSPYRV